MATFLFIVLLATYSVASARLVPRKYYSIANLAAALLAIIYGAWNGLSPGDMGLLASQAFHGLVIGLFIGIPVALLLITSVFHRKLQDIFSNKPARHNGRSERMHELLLRIPFGTALSEEIFFRGVLLGLLAHHGNIVAVAVSAILFGLWHVIPTLDTVLENDTLTTFVEGKNVGYGVSVMTAVISTTTAGIVFGWLRIVSGSLVAPWLVHFCINGAAIAGGYLILYRRNGRRVAR